MEQEEKIISQKLIKSQLDNTPSLPGVYRMFNLDKQIIYVGKAKNLKKRLGSYARQDLVGKVKRMVFLTHYLEYTVTNSEAEALLLEAQLIKKLQPRFNILLKDDKSFPYIKLRLDHDFPQLIKYRGKDLKGGRYFGPFSSSSQVDVTLKELQKIFKLRSCSDNYFASRSRPCLQYQIKRCYAPCVGKINQEDYNDLVEQVESFLLGKTTQLQQLLANKMDILSREMRFEEAAEVRDRIKAINYIQLRSELSQNVVQNADVIAIYEESNQYCVQVFLYRTGQGYGNNAYFPVHTEESNKAEVLAAFLGQFYQSHMPPAEIIINENIEDKETITEAIKQLWNSKVNIAVPMKGKKIKLIENACENARLALNQYLKYSAKNYERLQEIQELFSLAALPERIEVYDNSHIMGKFAVGAMIVATPLGFDKKEYRIFTIKFSQDSSAEQITSSSTSGDDYGMLREVLTRRFMRLQKEPEKRPGLIIIDGGKGHMSVVREVMAVFNLNLPFVCMSKGVDRNAGKEQFHLPEKEAFTLEKGSALMKYLQILRDEAHNFAIKSHRLKRSGAIKISSLDDIPTIGEKRKKALLSYFGSYKAICSASSEELAKVAGISKHLATNIYNLLRSRNIAG